MNPDLPVLHDASVISFLLREFSRQPVLEQAKLKAQLEQVVERALSSLAARDRVVLEAPEGLSAVVLDNPQAALDVARRAQESASELPLCIAINQGAVKALKEAPAGFSLVGDGLVAALTLGKLATRGRLLASRSFREALENVAPHGAAMLAPVGAFTDANMRKHELFTFAPEGAVRRRRRILAVGAAGVVALIAAGAGVRGMRAAARQPAVIIFDITPQGLIFVDGELKGVSPPLQRLELPPGPHTVEVRHQPHPPLKLAITVKPGQEMTVTHAFAGAKKRGAKDESFIEQLMRKWRK